jgi:hypothetical protein
MEEVKLWLDSYDDLYSDFDSRHYGKRRISEDLLVELRRAIRQMPASPQALIFILPESLRHEASEQPILENMDRFFTSQSHLADRAYQRKILRGCLLLLFGLIIMLVNTFITIRTGLSFSWVGLRVILEPAGWFFVWAGMDYLFYDLRELRKEKVFYSALAGATVEFRGE